MGRDNKEILNREQLAKVLINDLVSKMKELTPEEENDLFQKFLIENNLDPKEFIKGWTEESFREAIENSKAESAIPQESPPSGELSKGCDYQINNDPEFGFLLVRQKDYILQLINSRRYREARCCLTVLCELWTQAKYTYKYDELSRRLNEQRTNRHPED